ncbi:MAG TPA: tetratricopeptide repeat protein, partial [Longimicrobium sp.]
DHAISFSAAFYSSIAFGQSVQAAFNQACATLRMKGCPKDEIPQMVVRDGVDASNLVLIPDAEPSPLPAPIPPTSTLMSAPADPAVTPAPVDSTSRFALTPVPLPHPPMRRRVVWGAGAAALCGVSLALWAVVPPPPDPCAPAREVQRAFREAGPAPVGLLSAPGASADPGDPTAGPHVLAEARELHRAGDHAADLPLFEKAAQAGSVEAMVLLGRAYINGEGVAAQPEEGIRWLRKAAQTENPGAMNELGEAYLRREGVDRNYFRYAADYFQKAADKGHVEAMRNLANMYRDGRGVKADGAIALEWYGKAAKAGLVNALVEAGAMYERGEVVPRDADLAFCWYRAAGELGSPRGMMEQARLLESRGKDREARELRDRARQAGLAEPDSPAAPQPAR